MALRVFILVSTLLALAGCGGGGSDAPASGTNAAPVARAGSDLTAALGTSVTLDGSTSSDADGDALTYSWTLATAPSGSTAALSGASTARPSLLPDMAGVYALTLSVSDGRSSSTATVKLSVALPSIVLSQAEPLASAVTLSLGNDFAGSVTWFVDLAQLGTGAASVGAPIVWNPQSVANGAHQLMARIQTSATGYQEVRRAVTVNTAGLRAFVSCASCIVPSVDGRVIFVDVSAAPELGVTRVSALINGKDAGTLTAPNSCEKENCFPPGDKNTVYRFHVHPVATGSGDHTMLITVTEGSGATRTLGVPVSISNAPVITLAQPARVAPVHGTLHVQGTVASDKGAAVKWTVKARLGGVVFLETTAPNFSGSFDLTAVPGGDHVLQVEADDGLGSVSTVERNVVVASSPALAPQPVFTLPTGGQLLAVAADELLYETNTGDVVRRHISSGAETLLERARQLEEAAHWQFMAGRVYASGKGADCVSAHCIYAWNESGAISNLSRLNPFAESADQGPPLAKAGYVLWANAAPGGPPQSGFTLYDTVSQSYRRIPAPVIGIGDFFIQTWLGFNDLAVIGDVIHVFYDVSESRSNFVDMYEWRSDTGLSVRLNDRGSASDDPKTDGIRVAWSERTPGMLWPYKLVSGQVGAGAGTTIATGVNDFRLADGVLAWAEGSDPRSRNVTAIKASANQVTSTLATGDASSRIYANGGGLVFFTQQRKLYSWNSATRLSTLRLDTTPSQVVVAGTSVIFRIGTDVYRVPLNATP